MISNERVVNKPVKIDFHIHSAASAHKDGSLVKDGTVEHIDVLFRKLEENEVNMVAITDHDAFDYDVYDALCSKVPSAHHLRKVLPGVEFTVSFKTPMGSKPVHVVTLFDDADSERIKLIGDAIPRKSGKPAYDDGDAFTEDGYWNIIRAIGLDIVTIAHQKKSLSSLNTRRNDANSVGEQMFNEFLALGYFEAYEYKNRRNELFNKKYVNDTGKHDQLRFVTGSDCHVWDAYPGYDDKMKHEGDGFGFTYLKCLPTFKGLAMAVTDAARIKTVPSFFSGSSKTLDTIRLKLRGEDLDIPLSPGINAIIGDNSIGKSSLLNALKDFDEVPQKVRKGQEKYLDEVGLAVRQTIPEGYLAQFDGQEAIRNNFDGLNEGKAKKQLEEHFPAPVDSAPYRSFALGKIKEYISALKDSCEYQELLDGLGIIALPPKPPLDTPQSLTFETEIAQGDSTPHDELVSTVSDVRIKLETLPNKHSDILTAKDVEDLRITLEALSRIEGRHQKISREIKLESKVANKVSEAVRNSEKILRQVITDAQKAQSAFRQSITEVASSIAKAVMFEHKVHSYTFSFNPMRVEPKLNPVGNLQFICKLGVEEISPATLQELVDSVSKRKGMPDTCHASYATVADAIKGYSEDEDGPLAVLESKLVEALDKKLRAVKAINREGDDVYDELSRGYNAQLYFSLMADRNRREGLYIVDQPEDQISQRAIKETVLGEFRSIADSRQVILITHNPQFIVNLDVDNIIYIGRYEDGNLYIQSGALEYECEKYKVLDLVAENIEGGLETIRKRLKRYDKAS